MICDKPLISTVTCTVCSNASHYNVVSHIQGYGQEFPPSQQPPHLMGYSGNRGYKVSLMDHTATGSTSNCSSPSSLQSPITSMVSLLVNCLHVHVVSNTTV